MGIFSFALFRSEAGVTGFVGSSGRLPSEARKKFIGEIDLGGNLAQLQIKATFSRVATRGNAALPRQNLTFGLLGGDFVPCTACCLLTEARSAALKAGDQILISAHIRVILVAVGRGFFSSGGLHSRLRLLDQGHGSELVRLGRVGGFYRLAARLRRRLARPCLNLLRLDCALLGLLTWPQLFLTVSVVAIEAILALNALDVVPTQDRLVFAQVRGRDALAGMFIDSDRRRCAICQILFALAPGLVRLCLACGLAERVSVEGGSIEFRWIGVGPELRRMLTPGLSHRILCNSIRCAYDMVAQQTIQRRI